MLNSVLLFFDMSGGEMIVIALVALLVLGPQKMGDFARKAGKMMNEVKRVSSDFTSQLNEETGALREDLSSIKDTLKDAANNIKDEFTKGTQEVNKNMDPTTHYNINEPSNDVYNISTDPSEVESHPENVTDDNYSEHSDTQHVSKEEQTDIKPTSKQENHIEP